MVGTGAFFVLESRPIAMCTDAFRPVMFPMTFGASARLVSFVRLVGVFRFPELESFMIVAGESLRTEVWLGRETE